MLHDVCSLANTQEFGTVASTPRALFFTSASQRLALARQNFFEEGQVPSGAVNPAVLASWSRCQRANLRPSASIDFDLVSSSRSQLALQRNRPLVAAWQGELAEIERTLSGTACSAILTDPTGVLIATAGTGGAQAVITPLAHRIGVNLSEEYAGTTAPGLVLKTGKAATVLGGEHFFEGVMPMHCAAAPIHNTQGQLAGVLDISSEGQPFDFDMSALVGLYATSIENRLLITQSNDHLVLRIQVNPALLDTPLVGLVGIDGTGRAVWMNNAASSLLGKQRLDPQGAGQEAEQLFSIGLPYLLKLSHQHPSPIRLCNGLTVWVKGDLQSRDGIAPTSPRVTVHSSAPLSAPFSQQTAVTPSQAAETPTAALAVDAAVTLRELDNDLILKTVRTCAGNIAKAAKQLGVSRGLIYRRLKAVQADTP